jgi:glucan biosynthesis protein C
VDEEPTVPERRYDIDWLRVLATLTVFYFHNARFFDFESWHVKNDQRHIGFMIFVAFTWQWLMPLFFLLSGAGTLFGLRRRSAGQYAVERFKRLAIPYIMGIFLLIPPQRYLEALSFDNFSGSYMDFYRKILRPDYFDWNFTFLGHYGTHLWFIGLLFFLSLAALPIFLYLNKETGRRFVSKLASLAEKPGGIFLFVIPLAIVQMPLRAGFPGEGNWAEFFYYLTLFIYGYIIWSDKRFENSVVKHGNVALIAGVICFSCISILYFAGNLESVIGNPQYSAAFISLQFIFSLNTWCWLVFILSAGIRFLNFNNKGLGYASEAVLPFYILHQTVILIIGFYVVQWDAGMLVKYILISTASLAATIAIYDLCVRRTNATRFLFGMRPKRRPDAHSQVTAPGPGAA